MLLLVDDEPVVLRALVRAARAALPDVKPCTAETVGSAIGKLEGSLPIQAAIIDVHLGERSGFEIIEHRREQGSALPVLVLTGHDRPAKQRRAELLGAMYLPKPLGSHHVAAFWHHTGPLRYQQVIDHTARAARLAPRETELFTLLATGTPRSALGEVMAVTDNTIRSLLSRMRLKLGGRRLDDVILGMQRQCGHV